MPPGSIARVASPAATCAYNSATMHQPKRSTRNLAAACAALTVTIAGCSLLSGQPTPTPTATSTATASTDVSTETATPSPTPQLVKSVVLVAQLGEPKDWTPAGLTWKGIQSEAAIIGAEPTLIEPATDSEIPADLDRAATPASVVVTVGPDSDAAVQAAAAAHPGVQFLELDVAVPDSAPANVHGLVFDEAEAGYVAGYVAAAFATSGGVGMVGDTKTDPRSANYAAGVVAGASEFGPGVKVTVAYAGSPDAPDMGRTAATGLVKAGDAVIVALPSLSGIGAMRQACSSRTGIVGVDGDAWQLVPDVQACVIVSVLKRFDIAVGNAIHTIATGESLPRVALNDIASGGIALSDFHADQPAGLQAGLDAVMATLERRPTPSAAVTTAAPSASPSA